MLRKEFVICCYEFSYVEKSMGLEDEKIHMD